MRLDTGLKTKAPERLDRTCCMYNLPHVLHVISELLRPQQIQRRLIVLIQHVPTCLALCRDRGEPVPGDLSMDIAQQIKENYCYTCGDVVKVMYSLLTTIMPLCKDCPCNCACLCIFPSPWHEPRSALMQLATGSCTSKQQETASQCRETSCWPV